MIELQKVRLGDICKFQNGYAFKSKDFIRDGQYNVVKIKELKNGKVKFFEDTATIDLNIDEYENYSIFKGDVLFALTGDPVNKNNPLSWVGRVAIYKEDNVCLLNQRVCKVITEEDKILKEYVFYYFRVFENFYSLAAKATGSASQANISTKTIADTEMMIPSIETQKKIVKLLSALDDKIDNNNQINGNLEQQVQAIFKSWFIGFEPFNNVMPNSWTTLPLEQLCTVVTKGTTPTTLGKSFVQNGINFIKAESIMDNHSIDSSKFAFIDDETNTLLKRSIIQNGDIVFTIAGTLGRFALIDESVLPANTNQAVAIIRPDAEKISSEYLYSFFIGNWHNDYYSKRIQQAVQANLSLTTIKSLPITFLSDEEMQVYDGLVTPLLSMIKSTVVENRVLAELRNTLLPKLINGELDVSDINI